MDENSKYKSYVECVNLAKRGNQEIESRIQSLTTDIKKFLDKFIVPTDVISDGESLQLLHECITRKNDLEAEKLLGREFEVRKKGLGGEKTRSN